MNEQSLNSTLLAVQIFCACAVVIGGMLSKYGRYSLPFLISLVYLGWFLPQVYALTLLPYMDGLSSLQTMSLLSLAACAAGWYLPTKARYSTMRIRRSPDLRRLYAATATVTAFAWLMTILIVMQPRSQTVSGETTGLVTILLFFRTVLIVSLACSFYLFLKRRRTPQVCLLAANLAMILPSVFLSFRRADLLELGFVIILGLLTLPKQVLVPKWALVVGAVLGFFFIQGVDSLRDLSGAYRANAQGEFKSKLLSWDDLTSISWTKVFDRSFQETRTESRNGAYYFHYMSEDPPLLGADLWNGLVFAYFPAQIFGAENKTALMIPGPRGAGSEKSLEAGAGGRQILDKFPGQTDTGFVGPYSDFGYLGALVFMIVARMLRHQFENLVRNGDAVAYAIYSSLLTYALHSITHDGYYVFIHGPLLLATIAAIFYYARAPLREKTRRAADPRKIGIVQSN